MPEPAPPRFRCRPAGMTLSMKALDLLDLMAGLDYPVSREDLIRLAQELGAGNEFLATLRSLPALDFSSADELAEALGAAR